MQLFQKNKFYNKTIYIFLCLILLTNACENNDDFEQKAPPRTESRRALVDANVINESDKTIFEATFYYDISEIVDGKEVRGFGKNIIKVNDPKLNDIELKESTNSRSQISYTGEIPNTENIYELSFSPNDNLQAKHKINIDPIFTDEQKIRFKKGSKNELKLSRISNKAELPILVWIEKNEKMTPVSVGYDNGKLIVKKNALDSFPVGTTKMEIKFETNQNSRENNKSIMKLDYLIRREIEIYE